MRYLAVAGVFSTKAPKWVGASVGALGVQVLLRWPPHLFHGFPTAVSAILVIVCAVSAWRRSSERIRRRSEEVAIGIAGAAVILSIPLVIAGLMTRTEVLGGQTAARTALADAGSADATTVSADLGTAATDTNRAGRSARQLDHRRSSSGSDRCPAGAVPGRDPPSCLGRSDHRPQRSVGDRLPPRDPARTG